MFGRKDKTFSRRPLKNYIYISHGKLDALVPQLPPSSVPRPNKIKIDAKVVSAEFEGVRAANSDPERVAAVGALSEFILEHEAVGQIEDDYCSYIFDTVDAVFLSDFPGDDAFLSRDEARKFSPDGPVFFAGMKGDRAFVFYGSAANLVGTRRTEYVDGWSSYNHGAAWTYEYVQKVTSEGLARSARVEMLVIRHNRFAPNPRGILITGSPIYVAVG